MNECKIVQDLLPLYAEDLVSPESKEFVDEHCAGCEECARQRKRMCADLNQEKVSTDYKKTMRRGVLGIVGKTMLVCILAVGLFLYGLWESGFLNKQVYIAPNGNFRFQVVDCDAGFFDGGACITTPEGKDINLYGDKSYRDFQVWYAPDGYGYFAWISFDDHDVTWLCRGGYDEKNGIEQHRYYPDDILEERDFLSILKESELGRQYLTEDAIITFDRWSEAGKLAGRYIYFNYEIPGGWFGEIIYDVKEHKVESITHKFTRPPAYSGIIVH